MIRKLSTLSSLAFGLVFVAQGSASTYFWQVFNTNPPLAPSQAPNAWYPDRYRPNAFDSQNFGGDNRLHLNINAADGLAVRPSGYNSQFYNTQGRKYDLGNGTYTAIRGTLYVGSDWNSQLRRSDMWATTKDNLNQISGYPIIGFANVRLDTPQLVCRVYSQDTDHNPGNGYQAGWVDVSTKVPGGVVTNRWYTIEVRLKPGAFEYYVDGVQVYSDILTFGSTTFSDMMIQGYNFNDSSLGTGAYPPGLDDTYDIYWDDVEALPTSHEGFPVDLNGSYRSASSGPLNPNVDSATGISLAATTPVFGSQVIERNGVNAPSENALNGSFTPFNEATKLPNALTLATVDNTSLEADIELSGTWKPFQWGQGIGNIPPFATGDTFGVGWINSFNSFGVQVVTDMSNNYIVRLGAEKLTTGSIANLSASQAVLPAGTTKIRVNAEVVGGLLSGTVTTLDGPQPYTTYNLGTTDGTNLDTNFPWALTYDNAGYVAAFETQEHVAAAANATVTNFNTDAIGNALFLFADDPYVLSSDASILYRTGQANLGQAMSGYQAFMFAGAGQAFQSGTYQGPYNQHNPGVIGSALDVSGAAEDSNQANLTVANLNFGPGGLEVATGAGFDANTPGMSTLFSSAAPDYLDVLATTMGSNTVLIDNTAPNLTTPVLSGSAWQAPNVVQGDLVITCDAADLGAQQSGLAHRPMGSITWADSSVTPVTTYSLVGNTFQATLPITAGTPNGTASLTLNQTDRAGNTSSKTITFNVSTVNISIEVTEQGVSSPVSRVIRFKLGGNGGIHAAVTLDKVVAFNVPSGGDMKGTAQFTYQELDMADDSLLNNSIPTNAAVVAAYVKDPFFSLGRQTGLTGSAGSYSGSASLVMGDLTDNNVINVADLAVWAANNGTNMDPNTVLGQPAIPRQANIDGSMGTPPWVDLVDRQLIISSWTSVGDGDTTGGFSRGGDGSLTIRQVSIETGFTFAFCRTMDLNHDGKITKNELLLWHPKR